LGERTSHTYIIYILLVPYVEQQESCERKGLSGRAAGEDDVVEEAELVRGVEGHGGMPTGVRSPHL